MTIEVANVGPIRHARLSPGNLNVLIGTNDTGKTFFATVMHRLFASSTDAYFPDATPAQNIPKNIRDYVSQTQLALRRGGDQANDRELLVDQDMRAWANELNKSTLRRFGKAARRAISYAYGVPIERLQRQPVSYSRHDSYILVENFEPRWSIRIAMAGDYDSDDLFSISLPDPDTWTDEVFNPATIRRLSALYDLYQPRDKDNEVDPTQYIKDLCQYILFMRGDINLFRLWPNQCLHLPSERGGIMRSYRAITSVALRKSRLAGIEPIEIEPFDGTSSDFLSFLVSPGSDRRNETSDNGYADWANDLENKLRAKLELLRNPSGLDRFVATTPEGRFEFNQTSSMISEISAFVLALRHRLKARDYLTIDEPEAHLHPEMQIEIAKCLVDLASRGLVITFTTHSNYFVGQINNGIRSSELVADGKEEHQTDPQIEHENVRALLFTRGQDGCTAIDAKGNIVDPIEEKTFTKATRSLYDESVPLINQLLDQINAAGISAEQ